MNDSLIKVQIIVTWFELYQQGIDGLLKGDTVYIRELDHHTSNELGQCALAVDIQHKKEWVLPVRYFNIIDNED